MIKPLWYLTQIMALTLVVAWLLQQTGQFTLQLASYRIQGESGVVVIMMLVALLIILAVHRVWLWFVHFPKLWLRYRREVRLTKGHQALTRSLSALASGDARVANYQAWRARKFLPDFSAVPTILIATTAEKQGKTGEARGALQALLKTEARDLGVRGLTQAALNRGDVARALQIAREALRETPRALMLQRLVYDLECQNGEFEAAFKRQKILVRRKALSPDMAKRDAVVFHLEAARKLRANNDWRGAVNRAYAAHRLDVAHVPAACELFDAYIARGARRRAARVIEQTFVHSPHPDLCARWATLVPIGKKMDVRMKFFERLLAYAPGSGNAQLMLAQAAMNEQLWGEARSYLDMAIKLMPTMRTYKMLAHYYELQNNQVAAHDALEQATRAAPDDVWYCKVTGTVYDRFIALTPDHHFSSVVWGRPDRRIFVATDTQPSILTA